MISAALAPAGPPAVGAGAAEGVAVRWGAAPGAGGDGFWARSTSAGPQSVYFVGAEEDASSLISGTTVHELVHDARHLLGFPCH